MSKPSTNGVILRSIPLNRKMKQYWRSKYERIVANCGADEACRKFKELRVQLLSYIADSNRKANLGRYLSSTGFRINGYLRMLFEYAETQPHFVLSFVKMYSAPQKPTKSVDEAAKDVVTRLSNVKANGAVPSYLIAWLRCVVRRPSETYWQVKRNRNHPFHYYLIQHTYSDWCAYWIKWYRLLKRGWHSNSSLEYKQVFPEIYKDYRPNDMDSSSYQADVGDLFSLHQSESMPLSSASLAFIDEHLNEDVADALLAFQWGDTQGMEDLFHYTTVSSGEYVGHVQHIHKKGGGTDFRDIAVPNRFIQMALVELSDRLYNLVRQLPKDATFNQDRFDLKIQNRVNNPNLYQGSVDLSKATDNLPRSWGFTIIAWLQSAFGLSSERIRVLEELGERGDTRACSRAKVEKDFLRSLQLFKEVASANWEDEGFLVKWKVGQPLGSLPSFAMLAITHNLLVESLSLSLGLSHSPYVILGDDIVIMNKKLRKRYIRDLVSRGIPLSLHKSYEGRLSEFAGKTYVQNCVPFHTTDHGPVTWESLFDWQRATGIRIPWKYLPERVRSQAIALLRRMDISDSVKVPRKLVQLAQDSYDLVLLCEVPGRGTHLYPISDNECIQTRIGLYYAFREDEENVLPDPKWHTGLTMIGNGHPVVMLGSQYANKDGYFQRYRPVELPKWYKDKYRPCTTDAAILAAAKAVTFAQNNT